ncbi:MAG: HEAT repeat domain-containing protein [Pseudomonadota bacterium]
MSDTGITNAKTKTKTAVVDGQNLSAEEVAQVHEVKEIFNKLGKALKQIGLYRHNVDRYGEYLSDVFSRLSDYLRRNSMLDLRVGAINYRFRGVEVFRDESREGNLCFPFYQHGIRLLMFKDGLTLDELLKFLLLIIDDKEARLTQDDLITRLWKLQLQSIEWIVVESFKAMEDEDEEEVKVEVDKVVRYLYRQLQSNSEDVQRFARVSLEDLDLKLTDVDTMREGVIEGVTATHADRERVQRSLEEEDAERLLPKMVVILFQLLELDTTQETFEDVAEGFVQLLDAMLLAGDFAGIQQIRDRFSSRMQKNLKPDVRTLVGLAAQRFIDRMGESQRLSMISQRLNTGPVKDPEGLKAYLTTLVGDSVPMICDMLESIEIFANRRLICDVLVAIGKQHGHVFGARLDHPSSNMVKDMLYIIDKADFDRKFHMFARVLSHPNTILRLEALQTIGRNPTEECFKIVLNCFSGDDPQLRTAAARLIPNYEPNRAVEILLKSIQHDSFDKRERNEQKTIVHALSTLNHPQGNEYLAGVFAQKGGLLNRKKHDDIKLLIIESLALSPSIPVFQFLAAQAQNLDTNSKEVAEAARVAALEMRERLVGGRK